MLVRAILYKYPQAAFPYQQLIDENHKRGLNDPEFELIDTGILPMIATAMCPSNMPKPTPNDILMRVTVHNRGPEAASLTVLPQSGSATPGVGAAILIGPLVAGSQTPRTVQMSHPHSGLPGRFRSRQRDFSSTENETNVHRVFETAMVDGYFKDAFHDYVIHGAKKRRQSDKKGTKTAALYRLNVAG